MKASLREKRTWVRMGWELAALEKLAIDILCDGEYQAVMSKAALILSNLIIFRHFPSLEQGGNEQAFNGCRWDKPCAARGG